VVYFALEVVVQSNLQMMGEVLKEDHHTDDDQMEVPVELFADS